LDGFYHERQVQSCPSSRIAGQTSSVEPTHERTVDIHGSASVPMLAAFSGAAMAIAARMNQLAESTGWLKGTARGKGPEDEMVPPISSTVACTREPPTILKLADSIGTPVLDSSSLPSLGSAGHYHGYCKPCAFFHTKGCGNGAACPFCHLCPPGEKKQRRKAKITARKVRDTGA